jgi:hypothetical protein
LNLPPDLRYLPENVFVVGLLPSPFKPDAVLLTHLMDPIIKTILRYEPPGKKILTHYHPEGTLVQARIIPLIADLPAAREAGGFLSHAAIQYCWFCRLTSDENHRLDHLAWHYRTGEQVRRDAKAWKKLESIADRNKNPKQLVYDGAHHILCTIGILSNILSLGLCTIGWKAHLSTSSVFSGV